MSRAVFSKSGNLIYYLDDYLVGSTGYLVDYTKGDSSKDISFQCKIKVIDYMIFGTLKNSKKYFNSIRREYPGKRYRQLILKYSNHMILVCVEQISDWDCNLLTPDQITHIVLYENLDFKR